MLFVDAVHRGHEGTHLLVIGGLEQALLGAAELAEVKQEHAGLFVEVFRPPHLRQAPDRTPAKLSAVERRGRDLHAVGWRILRHIGMPIGLDEHAHAIGRQFLPPQLERGLTGKGDRMPVILDDTAAERWMNKDAAADELLALLKPYDGDLATSIVSKRVNTARTDDEGLIGPENPA